MSAQVTFTLSEPGPEGKQYVFHDRTTCVVGRSGGCSLRLPDDAAHGKISRYQCRFDIEPTGVWVRDLGSLNGTFLNGRKIGQRHREGPAEDLAPAELPPFPVRDGDEIQMGNTVLRVGIVTDEGGPDCAPRAEGQGADAAVCVASG